MTNTFTALSPSSMKSNEGASGVQTPVGLVLREYKKGEQKHYNFISSNTLFHSVLVAI